MSGPPRHIHHREDETFYLLSGQCVFWLDGTIYRKSAGEAMFIPRGVVHTFRIPGDVPCDHLTIMSPGGFEGFFAAMVAGQYRMPEDMSRVAEIAGRFDMSFTGPPLAEADIQL